MINQNVRNFLIRQAKRNRHTTYSEINRICNLGLNFSSELDRGRIGSVLGKIVTAEHEAGRPLLSSIVVYESAANGLGLGEGFYRIAEDLGIGSRAELKTQNFAEREMARTFTYWSEQAQSAVHSIPFFTKADLQLFHEVAGKPYRKEDPAAQRLVEPIKALYEKSNYWGRQLNLENFEVVDDNRWQNSGQFKKYSWSRIFKRGDEDKLVYFTVGMDGGESDSGQLVYKLDCQWSHPNKDKRLDPKQVERFRNYIRGSGADWRKITAGQIDDYNWDRLLQETRNFIRTYEDMYDDLIELLWREDTDRSDRKPLQVRRRPEGKHSAYPKKTYRFQGVNIDHTAEHAKRQYLGERGEQLVLKFLQDKLRRAGQEDLAQEVRKVKDGEGYDLFSYSKQGNIEYVEVKTTRGGAETPFYMSDNELEFARQHPEQYRLYRVYDYDPSTHTGLMFILTDVIENTICRQVHFEVQVKRREK